MVSWFAMEPLRFVRLSSRALPPSKGSPGAAGFDLHAAEDAIVLPGGRLCVGTGLQLEIPRGCYGRIAPRSGIAASHGIDVGAGVIDQDFRGEVKILLFNLGSSPFIVSEGDRVAQLILERLYETHAVEVQHLESTLRGGAGFGSTGR